MECDCGICDGGGFIDTSGAFSGGLGFGLGLLYMPYMMRMLTAPAMPSKIVVVCLRCGGKNPEYFKYCGYCGQALYPPSKIQCPKCNQQVPKANFCLNCGNKLETSKV